MKLTLAVWLAYLKAPWPDGWVLDDDAYTIDGKSVEGFDDKALIKLPPETIINVECGTITSERDPDMLVSLTSHIRAWIKKQNTAILVLDVPADQVEAFRKTFGQFKVKEHKT